MDGPCGRSLNRPELFQATSPTTALHGADGRLVTASIKRLAPVAPKAWNQVQIYDFQDVILREFPLVV